MAPGSYLVENAVLIFYPPNSDVADRFALLGGALTLSEASTVAGQPVVGSVDFTVWDTPFF